MTPPPFAVLLELGALALALGRQNRATRDVDGVTPETDTTHSIMLALLAYEVAAGTAHLDPFRAAALAVVHDLVEALAGDTNTAGGLSPDQAAEKAAREAAALLSLRRTLAGTHVLALLEEYETGATPEASFVRYLDKVLPRVTNVLNDGAVLVEHGRSAEWLEARQRVHADELAAKFPEHAELVGPIFDAASRASEAVLRRRESR